MIPNEHVENTNPKLSSFRHIELLNSVKSSLDSADFMSPVVHKSVQICDITPEHYKIWEEISNDPDYFKSGFMVQGSATVDEIIIEYVAHGLNPVSIKLFRFNDSSYCGAVEIPIVGPNSVLDYLYHQHKFDPPYTQFNSIREEKKQRSAHN